jgi:hypothetical protein
VEFVDQQQFHANHHSISHTLHGSSNLHATEEPFAAATTTSSVANVSQTTFKFLLACRNAQKIAPRSTETNVIEWHSQEIKRIIEIE